MNLKTIGGALLFFGVLSIIMVFFNFDPSIIAWIYNWGETTAWIIKIAFVVFGFLLTRIGRNES